MKFFRACVLTLLLCATSIAAHPYDSTCRVNTRTSGGSGTLIHNVEGQYAVVLGAKHVSPREKEWVSCRWGETVCEGYVWKVHPTEDICLMVVASPPGLKPVEVSFEVPKGVILVNAGYPSYSRGKLHYQTGTFKHWDSDSTFRISCAPWSGMSGGSCFYGDKVVGVIVTSHPSVQGGTSGGCTAGKALREILGK